MGGVLQGAPRHGGAKWFRHLQFGPFGPWPGRARSARVGVAFGQSQGRSLHLPDSTVAPQYPCVPDLTCRRWQANSPSSCNVSESFAAVRALRPAGRVGRMALRAHSSGWARVRQHARSYISVLPMNTPTITDEPKRAPSIGMVSLGFPNETQCNTAW